MKIEKQTYSYSLGLDLSLDTHTDEVLAVFQNGPKSLFMFIKCKQTWKSKNKQPRLEEGARGGAWGRMSYSFFPGQRRVLC